MTSDATKQVIGRYWGDLAATFDEQFLHSIATEGERRAWDRIVALLAGDGTKDMLDVGCGTGFLALRFAAKGHHANGSDLAPEMIARAREKAHAAGLAATFLVDDAEALSMPDASFDLVVSRHLLWTLPHPDQALTDWVRVTRPGGRVAVIDGQLNVGAAPRPQRADQSSMEKQDGDAVVAALPNFGGAPAEGVTERFAAHGLTNVRVDHLDDLLAAQRERTVAEGREPRTYVRYIVYGDKPA